MVAFLCLFPSTLAHSTLLQIKWSNRYQNDKGRTCLCTVDGTDYSIYEPKLREGKLVFDKRGRRLTVDPKWYSHKFEGPALRYEIAVCIQTGDIVWSNGPFPAGKWPDKKIFKYKLRHMLDENEMVEVDGTYSGMPFECRMPGDFLSAADKKAKSDARARHETINRRLKQFGILGNRYRHDIGMHKIAFRACAVCTQIAFNAGEKAFQVNY